ncbi:MAG: MAPEG family protein [Pseudomonadota bacterium]
MPLTITLFYAGVLGAWFLVLTVRVILGRRSAGVSLGSGEDRRLERRIRAHGNFAEYTPFALILLALLESQGTVGWLLHLCGMSLLVGRVLHGYALSFTPHSPLRVPGMVLTLVALVVMVVMAILVAVF